MSNQHYIMRCLPLLAAVLGDRYGIEVQFHGNEAKTNGKVITLPALSPDSSEDIVAMVRGYIDHESAHIRHTDFQAVNDTAFDHITKWLFNALEDWRVERELSAIYPGCRQNMHWLASKLFVEQNKSKAGAQAPASGLLRYVLLSVRSWEVPDIAPVCQRLREKMELLFSGVPDDIDMVLAEVRQDCNATGAAIAYARRLADILKQWASNIAEGTTESSDSQGDTTDTSANAHEKTPVQDIAQLFADPTASLPDNIGEMLEMEIADAAGRGVSDGLTVAKVEPACLANMGEAEKQTTLQSSVALRTRLQSLMQTTTRRHMSIGRKGVLHSGKLHRVCTGDTRVFKSYSETRGLDTAVHILLDASGSMREARIKIANQACFAIGHVLSQLRGINPAITAFHGNDGPSVMPILRHGDTLLHFAKAKADGGTPLAPALWWVLQQLVVLREQRKIVLIITDGAPDKDDPYVDALDAARHLGIEVYGLGILTACMEDILPNTSRSIETLSELPTAMFSVLQRALFQGGVST